MINLSNFACKSFLFYHYMEFQLKMFRIWSLWFWVKITHKFLSIFWVCENFIKKFTKKNWKFVWKFVKKAKFCEKREILWKSEKIYEKMKILWKKRKKKCEKSEKKWKCIFRWAVYVWRYLFSRWMWFCMPSERLELVKIIKKVKK